METDAPMLDDVVAKLAATVAALPPGLLAELRRGGGAAGSPTFWRLWHGLALPYGAERWEEVVKAIAILTPTGSEFGKKSAHSSTNSFGKAMFDGGVSETRFARLLALTADGRRDALVRLVRSLAGQEVAFDLRPLVRLMLFDSVDDEKRRIARDFFAAEAAAMKTKETAANA